MEGDARSWEIQMDSSHSGCSVKLTEATNGAQDKSIFINAAGRRMKVLAASVESVACRIVQGNVFQ
jgi:hypothetical protein